MPNTSTCTELENQIKELERRLQKYKSEAVRYKTLFELFPYGITISDALGEIIEINSAAKALMGLDQGNNKKHFTDEKEWQVIRPDGTDMPYDEWPGVVALNQNCLVPDSEMGIVKNNGEISWLNVTAAPLQLDRSGVAVIYKDISKQKAIEQAMSESDKKYRILVENANDAIFVTQNEKILFPNPKTVELTGYTIKELSEMHFTDFIHVEDKSIVMDRYRKRMSGEKPPSTYNYRIMHKSGKAVWVQINLASITWEGAPAVLAVIRDISNYRRMERQLQQAQKMEAIGNLAGGVAHDYNNISGVIMGYAELALTKLKPDDSLYTNVKEILNATKRSTEITRQLLAFARKQTIEPIILDLNNNIEKMIKMIRRLIGEDIDLAWIPGDGIWNIKIDPSQVDQIVVNLCVNARDAIEGVGKILIETSNAVFDARYCDDHLGFKPGEYVMLAISDNGKGMTQKQKEKAFEPFYTTKGMGKGTGLGLSTVYGIAKQNNGFINIYSELSKGTIVKTYFPRHTCNAVDVHHEKAVCDTLSKGETVLLVEDDSLILDIAKKILETLGYKVISYSNPNDVMAFIAEYSGKIDLMITDVVLPVMNGKELSEKIKHRYPEIKVLYMSGYTANVIAHHGVLDEGINFIAKPFLLKDFAAKVREALGCD